MKIQRLLAVALAAGTVLAAVIVVLPYLIPGFQVPEVSDVEWTQYHNPEIGFSLELPVGCRPIVVLDENEARVFFEGDLEFHVIWTDEERARDHGLWARHEPVSDLTRGGLPGKKYIYNHYDGPFGVRTYAFVLPHRGKLLALEFRTRRASMLEEFGITQPLEEKPAAVFERISASFRPDGE